MVGTNLHKLGVLVSAVLLGAAGRFWPPPSTWWRAATMRTARSTVTSTLSTSRPSAVPHHRLYDCVAALPGGAHLCSLTTTGSVHTIGAVSPNLTGGLVYHAPNDCFYAASNEPGGQAMLHQVSLTGPDFPLFPITPHGVVNGLAYVRGADTFYALITQDDFTWFYSFTLNGTVTQLFGAGLRVFGGLCHSPSENLFYFVANEPDGFSRLWTGTSKEISGPLAGVSAHH